VKVLFACFFFQEKAGDRHNRPGFPAADEDGMASKDEKSTYEELLEEAKRLTHTAGVPPAEEEFSLEDILSEFGGGRERQILREAAEAAGLPQEPEPAEPAEPDVLAEEEPAASAPPAGEAPPPETPPAEPKGKAAEPKKPAVKPEPDLSVEDVVGRTVEAVQERQREEWQARSKRAAKRRLFARKPKRPVSDTDAVYEQPKAEKSLEPEWEREEEPIGPEPTLTEAAAKARLDGKRRGRLLPLSALATLLLGVVLVLDQRGVVIPLWTGDVRFQTGAQLGWLLVVALLCGGDVFRHGFSLLARRRWSGDLIAIMAALVSGADCVYRLAQEMRTDAAPYVLPACAALTAAQWGVSRRGRGQWEMFRAASITEDPPYLVTDTPQGACKQRGRVEGFYTDALRDDLPLLWQTVLVPVILMGTVVFACLSSLGQGRNGDFLLCWSAILSGAASLGLPLAWSLPWSKTARRLQKSGCALAGWTGAAAVSSRKAVILTDADLFPPGSVSLNGIRVFGESVPHAVSYAASLVRATGSGLVRLFDEQLRGGIGHYCEVDDFQFYKDGGCAGNIRGESVLLGTAAFMKRMGIHLPKDINLRTGLYMAVDKRLQAVFAVKYNPEENVDWALRLLKRNHITPILASRDPNITPSLIKRKFYKGVRLKYPPLEMRLALSEQEGARGRPRALLLREGLLPYAETVIGARRLRRSVWDCTALSLLGSAAGTLLTFYLAFQGTFGLMPPLTILAFSALWALPVVLLSAWTSWY